MTHRRSLVILLTALFPIALLIGCGADTEAATTPDPGARAAARDQPAEAPMGLNAKVKWKRDGETEAYSLKPKDDGAKLVDANEQELARYNVDSSGKIKIKDAADVVLGYVNGDLEKVKLKDPNDQEIVLLQLIRQDDGDFKVEDGAETLLAKIKRRDYGWKMEDASGTELGKLKVKDGKTSVRNPGDETVLYTKDVFGSLAAAVVGLAEPLGIDERVAMGIALKLHLLGAG